jgi:hypothetical protein
MKEGMNFNPKPAQNTIESGTKLKEKVKTYIQKVLILSAIGLLMASNVAKAHGDEEKEGKKKAATPTTMQKVSTNPEEQGFVRIGTENINGVVRNIFERDSKIPLAKAVVEKGGKWTPADEEAVQKKLANGVTPEQLVEAGYISKDEIPKYLQYYKPIKEFVYTEDSTTNTVPVSSRLDSVKVQKFEMETKVPPPRKMFTLGGYKKFYGQIDMSPSMKNSRKILADALRAENVTMPFEINGFTSKIDTSLSASNTDEAADIIEHMNLVEDDDEWAIDALLAKIKTIENSSEKKLMVVFTDEELQKVSKNKLEQVLLLAEGKNLTIEFNILMREYDDDLNKEVNHMYKLSLSDVGQEYQRIFDEKIQQVIDLKDRQIAVTERQIRETELEIGNTDAKTARQLKKTLPALQQELAGYKKAREDCQIVNVGHFAKFSKPLFVGE